LKVSQSIILFNFRIVDEMKDFIVGEDAYDDTDMYDNGSEEIEVMDLLY